jgi:ABC-type Fe3+-hydroxamate transport system substrate-binding protein
LSKRFIVVLASALAIASLAVGCGGGDSTAGDTSTANDASSDVPALTKAEFIAQGDAICTKTLEKNSANVQAFLSENGLGEGEAPSPEQEEELVSTVILPQFQAVAEELGKLGPPEGEEAEVEEIVTGIEDAVAEGEDDPSGVIGGGDPFEDVNEKAKELGFKSCAEL